CCLAILFTAPLCSANASSDLVSTSQPNQIDILDPNGPGGLTTPFVSILINTEFSATPAHVLLGSDPNLSDSEYFDVYFDGSAEGFPSRPPFLSQPLRIGADVTYSNALIGQPLYRFDQTTIFKFYIDVDLGDQGAHELTIEGQINAAQSGL